MAGSKLVNITSFTDRPEEVDVRINDAAAKEAAFITWNTPGLNQGVTTIEVAQKQLAGETKLGIFRLVDTNAGNAARAKKFVEFMIEQLQIEEMKRQGLEVRLKEKEISERILGLIVKSSSCTTLNKLPPIKIVDWNILPLGPDQGMGKYVDKILDTRVRYEKQFQAFFKDLMFVMNEKSPTFFVDSHGTGTEILNRLKHLHLHRNIGVRADFLLRNVIVPTSSEGLKFWLPWWRWIQATSDLDTNRKILTMIVDNEYYGGNVAQVDLDLARVLNSVFSLKQPRSLATWDATVLQSLTRSHGKYCKIETEHVRIPVVKELEETTKARRYSFIVKVATLLHKHDGTTKTERWIRRGEPVQQFANAVRKLSTNQAIDGQDSLYIIWVPFNSDFIKECIQVARDFVPKGDKIIGMVATNSEVQEFDEFKGEVKGYVFRLAAFDDVPYAVARAFELPQGLERVPDSVLDQADAEWPYVNEGLKRLANAEGVEIEDLFLI